MKLKNINRLMTDGFGQKRVRFYDPDGNLIEVRTPKDFFGMDIENPSKIYYI